MSSAALDVARRLVVGGGDSPTDDATLLASAERIGGCVPDGLARWFGPYGALALVSRALTSAAANHPALGSVRVSTSPAPHLIGLSDSAKSHGAVATAEAIIELLASLHELLGRLIGDDMALMLLEQCTSASARDPRPTGEKPSHTMDEQ